MNTMTDNYLTPDALAVIERAKALAPKLAARAQQAAFADIGRNDPCPCGSGKKYKKCCGR